jgi:hypothetical protein
MRVVLETLVNVARAGRERVMAGMMRNLQSPIPDGGSSFSFRLRRSMIKSPDQKTGRLNPITDREEIALSRALPLLTADIKPRLIPTGTAIIIAPNARINVLGNLSNRSSRTFLFV